VVVGNGARLFDYLNPLDSGIRVEEYNFEDALVCFDIGSLVCFTKEAFMFGSIHVLNGPTRIAQELNEFFGMTEFCGN